MKESKDFNQPETEVRTSEEVAKKAGKQLQDKESSKDEKSVAGSALAQKKE